MFFFLISTVFLLAVEAMPPMPTTIKDHPWLVSIELKGVFRCAGAIISDNAVVTTALCVNQDKKNLEIRAGTSNLYMGGSVHKVKEIDIHSKYANSFRRGTINDIAIVYVENLFKFGESIQSIAINQNILDLTNKPEKPVTLVGWTGAYTTDEMISLQSIQLLLTSEKQCNSFRKVYFDNNSHICLTYYEKEYKGPCPTNIGSPIVQNKTLIGFIMSGDTCGSFMDYIVGIEVAAYTSFLSPINIRKIK